MLVDVDWVSDIHEVSDIHDKCELIILMVYLRWQLKHTSGWIEAPDVYQDLPVFFLDRHPGSKGS